MATDGFTFEELAGGSTGFVPASRKKKKSIGLDMDDFGGSSDKIGTLPKDQNILSTIRATAKEVGVPEEYLFALADQESGYNPAAKNSEFGATGIMQYIPETAKARGIDPSDPTASIRAAAEDFKAAMDEGGVEWAIKHHFAGPDVKGHGPKTRQYLADVMKRAEDIKGLLGSVEENPAAVAGVGGGSDAGLKQSAGFSFDELQETSPATVQKKSSESFLDSALDVGKQILSTGIRVQGENAEVLEETAGKVWDFVKQRISDIPKGTLRGQEVRKVQVDDKQITELTRDMNQRDAEFVAKTLTGLRSTNIRPPTVQEESEDIRKRNEQAELVKGFWDNLDSPAKLILQDSLPANFIESAINAPDNAYKKFAEAQRIMQQYDIVRNPSKFPAQAVDAARREIARREVAADDGEGGIKQMWGQLVKAAKTDPGGMAAQFVNTIVADPEMLMAPEGIGVRLVSGVKKVTTGAEVVSKAARVADKVVDAATTNAALNLGIEEASALSEGRHLTTEEAKTAAITGAGLGGALAGLGGIFSRGASKLDEIRAGKVGEADLQNALREVAESESVVDAVVNRPADVPTAVRDTIEETLGIKNMSTAEKQKWHKARQAELSKTFKENSLDADYYNYLAEERITRRTQLAEAAETRRVQDAQDAIKQQEVEQAYQEVGDARRARFASDYDEALAAKEQAKLGDEQSVAQAEDKLRNVTKQLDEQEILDAAMHEDVPAIRRAMGKAVQRDAKLARPKWQRGEVDPKLLAGIGVGGLFAGAGYALAPPEQKVATAFAAGLAGLLLPKGGNVLSRMRQAGAISADGEIFALARLVKEGKMKPTREIEEIKARERELIQRAKQGDQAAYGELFKDNFPTAERYAKKFLRGTDIPAEDIAQEAFVKAFQNLESFQGDSQFSTWLYSIVKNAATDARRSEGAIKAGGEFDVQSATRPDVMDAYGERYAKDVFDEGAGAHMEDTPENQKIREDSEKIIANAVERMNPRKRETFILSRGEGHTAEEIAEMTKQPLSTVLNQMKAAQDEVLEAVRRGFGARKREALPTEVIEKRGRGRPRKQVGEIDPRLLQVGGAAVLGAAAGAYLNEQNKLLGAGIGAALGAGLMTRGRKGTSALRQIVDKVDYTTGITSTRIMNISKQLWWKAHELERTVLRDTHKHMSAVDPFLVRMQRLPKDTRDILTRAILTGKPEVTNKILTAIGDQELIGGWKTVRSTLDSLKDQLVAMRRFKPGQMEYFPRVVKDVEGLLKALGKERGSFLEETIKAADNDAIRTRGTGLSDLEKSLIINKVLKDDRVASQQPGFAKNRGIEEITPELQPFYANPTESLHSYIREAVQDIERAKFFGRDLAVIAKGDKEFTNVDTSVGNMVLRLMNEGKLNGKQAEEVASLLKSRFINGERAPAEIIQAGKNLSYAGLLGNPLSAATQLGDAIIQAYTQDMRSALGATVRSLTGRKIVSMKDFGLVDHIAEEFVSTSKSARALNKIFKFSLFSGVDAFGKNVALNAAVIRFGRLARSQNGIQQLTRKFEDVLGPGEIQQLVKDLQKGEATDLVRSVAFAELTRTQPVTRLELPQAYLDNPNGRLLYQYKTFMLKQIDLARRDAYNEIKKGGVVNVARGLKNLTHLGIALGVAGTTTSKIQDFLTGKEVDFKASDIPMNMFKTFGLSQYVIDHGFGVSKEEAAQRRSEGDKGARAIKAEPLGTTVGMFTPPAKMFDEILRSDPKAVRYIPFIGPFLAEQVKAKESTE